VPQFPDRLVQLAVQFTPALLLSLLTTAIRLAVSEAPTALSPTEKADGETVMLIGGGGARIVMFAVMDTFAAATDVAVMVTGCGGTEAGAVYVALVVLVVPESVLVSVPKVPQAPAVLDPQLASNVAPTPVTSLLTSTVTAVLAPSPRVAEGAGANESAMAGASIVSVTLLVADGLLVTDAVIVTVPPMGAAVGAVYTDAAPSAVCAGEKVPHAPPVRLPVTGLPPHVTVQSTPASRASLTGVMVTCTFEPITSDLIGPETVPLRAATEIAPASAPDAAPHPRRFAITATPSKRARTQMDLETCRAPPPALFEVPSYRPPAEPRKCDDRHAPPRSSLPGLAFIARAESPVAAIPLPCRSFRGRILETPAASGRGKSGKLYSIGIAWPLFRFAILCCEFSLNVRGLPRAPT
jgi:hypothetical protein